jgi:hypothetical protein
VSSLYYHWHWHLYCMLPPGRSLGASSSPPPHHPSPSSSSCSRPGPSDLLRVSGSSFSLNSGLLCLRRLPPRVGHVRLGRRRVLKHTNAKINFLSWTVSLPAARPPALHWQIQHWQSKGCMYIIIINSILPLTHFSPPRRCFHIALFPYRKTFVSSNKIIDSPPVFA